MMKKLHLNIVSPEKELFKVLHCRALWALFLSCRSMHRLYHRWERGN